MVVVSWIDPRVCCVVNYAGVWCGVVWCRNRYVQVLEQVCVDWIPVCL